MTDARLYYKFSYEPNSSGEVKIFLSKIRTPRFLIFGLLFCRVDLYQTCSNYSPGANNTCHGDRIARLTAPCPSHKKL